jgi:hypothetical protein
VQIINHPGAEILPDSRDAATDANIAIAGGCFGLIQRRFNAFGNKSKLGAASHFERRPGVMSQHEDGHVIGRLITPPTLPTVVGPWTSHGPEHVAAEYPGADSFKAKFREVVVDSRFAIRLPMHLTEDARAKGPIHQLRPINTERVLQILIEPGAVTVNGNAKTLNPHFRH